MIGDPGVATVGVMARFVLHELLESIFRQLFVLNVIRFVLFCEWERKRLADLTCGSARSSFCIAHEILWGSETLFWSSYVDTMKRFFNPFHSLSALKLVSLHPLPTHISFVLEVKVASWSQAMEMRGPLLVIIASQSTTIFRGAKPLKSLAHYGRVFAMVIGVHLNVGRTDVALVTTRLLDRGRMRVSLWSKMAKNTEKIAIQSFTVPQEREQKE